MAKDNSKTDKVEAQRKKKIQPKLRMFSNCDTSVNAIRAEHASSIGIRSEALLKGVELQRGSKAAPLGARARAKLPTPKTLKKTSPDTIANVFIELDDDKTSSRLPGETIRAGNIVTAHVPLSDIDKIAGVDNVMYVSLGESMSPPQPVIASNGVSKPKKSTRGVSLKNKHKEGAGVLIGIIDVQGFDFAHPDFLDDDGNTRFYRIWDQRGGTRETPKKGGLSNLDYGSEFTDKQMNAAIKAAPGLNVSPLDLEPQSQMSPGSHGTHVASIAAGNFGVCPKATLAGVLISLSEEDTDRRRSFYDSSCVANAVAYLVDVAEHLNMPLSINVSLGTNGHAHDASSAASRWLDSVLAVPGRSISVAAGNAGQEAPDEEGDMGFIMGRIHTSGRIPARGLNADIEWLVVGNTVADLSENELEIWYEAQDRFSVSLKPPGPDSEWIGPVEPSQFIENQQLGDRTFVSIYNELYHPANGSNYISIYLSPFFSQLGVAGVSAGRWLVRLHGLDVRDGRYHGWIERDDPRRLGKLGPTEAWNFPSFFSEKSNIDNSSVSSLACGHRVISVANLDAGKNRINSSSSQGPTRDGRPKPDICAPGTDIVAANGFGSPEEPWIAMSGTSMACPYVTGVIGLMLAVEPRLTAAQINGIIKRTAMPLPGADYVWRDDAGFGAIAPEECVKEAEAAFDRKELTK